ncbi:unnamed protein product [Absidia cylindrospora]
MIVDHVSDFHQRDLHACSLVNKQFHEVTNPLLWRAPKLDNDLALNRLITYLIDAESPSHLTNQIRSLTLHGEHWTDTYLLLLLPYIRHLETLNIGDSTNKDNITKITNESLKHLPRHCRRLEELDVSRCYLSKSFYLELGQHCHQLRALALEHCPNLPPDIFKLLDACLLDCVYLDYQYPPLGKLYGELVTDMARLDRLNSLTMKGLDAANTKQLVAQNTTTWPYLYRLHLDHCDMLDDTTLIPFLRSHPELYNIDLSSGSSIVGVTDATLDAMTEHLPDLDYLSLTNVSNTSPEAIRRLVRGALKLTTLALENSCNLADTVLDHTELDSIRQRPV